MVYLGQEDFHTTPVFLNFLAARRAAPSVGQEPMSVAPTFARKLPVDGSTTVDISPFSRHLKFVRLSSFTSPETCMAHEVLDGLSFPNVSNTSWPTLR